MSCLGCGKLASMLAGTRFGYRNLLTIPRVGDFTPEQISPDGNKIIFCWDRSGEDQIYQIDLNSLNAPDICSTGPGANISPRYSPNGKYFAFLHDRDGSETYELCLYDLSKNLQIQLNINPVGSLQPNITWSPDGKYLAYISDETGIFRTYVVELDAVLNDPGGISSRLLFDHGGPHWSMSFSPDNLWIAIVSESKGQDYAAYIISLANPDLQGNALTNQHGQILNIPSVAWSPDSSKLAFVSNPKGVYEIGIFDLACGKISWLPTAKGEKSMPTWSSDGSKLAFVLSRGPETWLGVHLISEKQNKLFQIGP